MGTDNTHDDETGLEFVCINDENTEEQEPVNESDEESNEKSNEDLKERLNKELQKHVMEEIFSTLTSATISTSTFTGNVPSTAFQLKTPTFTYVTPPKEEIKVPVIKDIKAFLDLYVIGQEEAKKSLCVAIRNHYIRIKASKGSDVNIQKSNILMMGDSGSGKTLLVETIAKFLDVPFASFDATSLTPTGIVGKDIDDVLKGLITKTKGNIKKAEKGIVFIDEIDKIIHGASNSMFGAENSFGEAKQAVLLKMLEGDTVEVTTEKSMYGNKTERMNTSNILFICAGAFSSLRQSLIVANEKKKDKIGFAREVITTEEKKPVVVCAEHLIKHGMMPEMVGRLPVIVQLDTLTKEDLVRIMTEPKNAIVKQFQKILEFDGIELEFTAEALEHIAEKAIENKIGARGLRGAVESVVSNIIYELDIPADGRIRKCVVTLDNIQNKTVPELAEII